MLTRSTMVLAALLLLTAPLHAQATSTQENIRVPIEFQITSCTGEVVNFLGEMHILQHGVGNANSGHFTLHINFHLEGTSPSGTRYVVNEHVNSSSTSAGAQTFTNEARLVAVAQGPEDNLIVHTFIHTTVNANGEVTSERFVFESDCQG